LPARHLRAHNLTEAAVMLATSKAPQALALGRWVVSVAENGHRTLMHGWMTDLCFAVEEGFEVRHYWDRVALYSDIVFYGLDTSAEAAAHSFARYFAHLETTAQAYGGVVAAPRGGDDEDDDDPKDETCKEGKQRVKGLAMARVAYRTGVADGLRLAFEAEREEETARVTELEIRVEKERRARARAPPWRTRQGDATRNK